MGLVWRKLRRLIGTKRARGSYGDPRATLARAITDAQDQHRQLKVQVAYVFANRSHAEARLNRALTELEKMSAAVEQAIVAADDAKHANDAAQESHHMRAAESLAERMVATEDHVESLKELHLETVTAAEQAQAALDRSTQALQQKLTERQGLMSRLDQAKVQEQLNIALTQLSERAGDDDRTLARVRSEIEERYARAAGTAEATAAIEGATTSWELERLSTQSRSRLRIERLRKQLGTAAAEGGNSHKND